MIGKRSHEIDMLHGPLLPRILQFSIPLCLSNLLQILFNAADVIIVGRCAGSGALAAVGSTTIFVNLIVNFFIGLSLGANIYFAKNYAAGEHEKVSRGVHSAVVFSVLVGLACGALGFAAAPGIIRAMATPEEILDMAVTYVRIYMLGLPAIVCYNYSSAAMRSVGDTERPMYYLLAAGILNVILNLFTVIRLGMGVAGVAIATTVSNYTSALLVLQALVREKSCLRLELSRLKIEKRALKEMLRLGIPSGIQSSMFGIANVLIQSSVNSFGAVYIAGNAAAVSLEGFILTAINAFSAAGLTFGSQNVGVRKYRRSDEVIRVIIAGGVPIVFVIGAAITLSRRFLLSLYNNEPSVIGVGSIRVAVMMMTYWLEVIMNGFNSAMRALGHTVEPMAIAIFTICIFRIVYLHTVFRIWRAYETIVVIWPISWILAIIVSVIVFRRIRRRYPAEDLS